MPSVASSDIDASSPSPSASSAAPGSPALLALDVGLGALHAGRRQLAAAAAPEPVEHAVVDLAVVAPAHEHGGAGVAHARPAGPMSTSDQRPGEVDRRAEVDLEARAPAAPARSRPTRPRRRRPSTGSPVGAQDRIDRVGRYGTGHRGRARVAGPAQAWARRPRRGSVAAVCAADLADVLLVLEDDAQRLVDDVRRRARRPRATAARPPSRASRRRPGPWSGRRSAAGGRTRRPRGRAGAGASGTRVETISNSLDAVG